MSEIDKQQDKLIREAIRVLDEEYEESQEFNESFDGDEPVRVGQLEFPKSKTLFWLDREAYYEQQESWFSESLQEKHEDCLKLLHANEHVPPFRELADAIARQRIVPFVGAGLSEPMGMPLWGAAMRKLHDRIHNPNDPAVTALIDQGRYLEAAQALSEHSQVLTDNFIRTTYRVQKVAGPVSLMPHVAHGCIVTTNFDDAIEETFKLREINFDGYMHGTQQHNFFSRLVRGQRCILKLHGDADDPQTYVLTRAQYLEAYEEPLNFQRPLPKALRQIYISNSLLFLGCSLEQDLTLDLFRKVKQQSEYEIPHHYAFLPEPASAQKKQQKEASLLELNIQPVWYPTDEHEYVEKLLLLAIDVANKRITLDMQGAEA
jgi:hypothetical protein